MKQCIKSVWLLTAALMIGSPSFANENPATFYKIVVTDIDGKKVPMSQYKGKALLIVNTASKCGFTPQYEGLEAVNKKYAGKGLVVLGFPSNDFGAQEPGANNEIKKFCEKNYKVTFPLFSKAPVTGKDKQPLYKYLTEETQGEYRGEISWNFEKYIIGRDGKVVARFKSKVTPESAPMTEAIELALKGNTI